MREGKVAMVDVYDRMRTPDEFSIVVKGDEGDTSFIYAEKFFESREEFFSYIEKGVRRRYDSKKKAGIIVLRGNGRREEVLAKLFNEVLLQLKFYIDDDEIKQMVDDVKVLSGRVKR